MVSSRCNEEPSCNGRGCWPLASIFALNNVKRRLTWTSLLKEEERHGNHECRKIIGRGCCWSRPIMERSLSGWGHFSSSLCRSQHGSTCALHNHAAGPELGRGCHPPIHRLKQVGLPTR